MKTLLILLISTLALYGEVASIVALRGEAYILRDNKEIRLTMDSKLEKSDQILTKDDAKLQLQFKDNTIITVGKNSTLNIVDFAQDNNNKEKNSFAVKFGNGVFKSITGGIGKLNPKRYDIRTKTSTIGIRGTTIFVESAPQTPDKIACLSGLINVTAIDTNITVEVPAGQITQVEVGEKPQPPRVFKSSEVNALDAPTEQKKEESGSEEKTQLQENKNTPQDQRVPPMEQEREEPAQPHLENVNDSVDMLKESIKDIVEDATDVISNIPTSIDVVDTLPTPPELSE